VLKVYENVGALNVNVIFPNKAFVFGQYKKIDLIFSNKTSIPVDKIFILSSKPLNTGFIIQEFDGISPNSVMEKSIYMRATMLKPFDKIDFLVIYSSKSYLRTFKLTYTLKVSKSFKTKCIIEKLNNSKNLVCIDVFDSQDPNLHLEKFFLNSVVMLSTVMQINNSDSIISKLSSDYFKRNNLVYFYINSHKTEFDDTLLRQDKQVFYNENNKLVYNNNEGVNINKVVKSYELSDKAFKGYLDQENRVIKAEFHTLGQSLKSKGLDYIKFYCREFLDFEILWHYTNKKEESRNLRLFSQENDDILLGQHSIISTPVNSISYKQKKSKTPNSPIFNIRMIVKESSINHDFKKEEYYN